jgi:hypothetical protein
VRSFTIPSRLPTDRFMSGHVYVVEPPSRACSSS